MRTYREHRPAFGRVALGASSTEAVRAVAASYTKTGMTVFSPNQPITALGNERSRWREVDS